MNQKIGLAKMGVGRFIGRFLGGAILLSLAFIGGVCYQDLRSVRNLGSLITVANLVPARLETALMTAAHGQGADYSPEQEYADVLATLKANYYGVEEHNGMTGGIGVTLATSKTGQPYISKVYADGAGMQAGIKTGDILLKVNGQGLTSDTDPEDLIWGEPNSPVTLTVQHKGAAAPLTLTVQRAAREKQIDSTQMTYNGIRGMMGALHDRYTRFMDPVAYKEMMDDNQGEFVGIGALLGTNKQQQVYVVRVLPGGPALKSHVLAGDIIMKVDGRSTLKMKDTDVVKMIRGEPNTKVTLTLLRKTAPKPVILTITRDVVQQEVVQYAMIDPVNKIGYISLSVFNEESDIQLNKALTDLQGRGMRGLVFDLRENPGGLLDIAVQVASRFVPSGPIVWIKDKSREESLDVIPSQHNHPKYPLVVLVNGNSASAAEITSGAIKDTGGGLLVGEKTFGKGLVQTIMSLPDGSAVAITTQHYYTAHKNDINHKGIQPNVVVTYTDDDQRKMFAYLRDHPEAFYDLKYDRQLQRAIGLLRQRMTVASARSW